MFLRKNYLAACKNSECRYLLHPGNIGRAFIGWMNRRKLRSLDLHSNGADGAELLVEQYFADHPGSPSAVRRPKVLRQRDMFIALLGPDVQHGIVGLGNTVENALRVFDLQYLSMLRPPNRAPQRGRSHSRT